MFHRTLAAIALLVRLPVTFDPAPPAKMETRWQETTTAYLNCLFAEADPHVSGTASPADIAENAVAGCDAAFLAYRAATSNYFVSLVSRREELKARAQAREHSHEFRNDCLRGVANRVIRARETTEPTALVLSPSPRRSHP